MPYARQDGRVERRDAPMFPCSPALLFSCSPALYPSRRERGGRKDKTTAKKFYHEGSKKRREIKHQVRQGAKNRAPLVTQKSADLKWILFTEKATRI